MNAVTEQVQGFICFPAKDAPDDRGFPPAAPRSLTLADGQELLRARFTSVTRRDFVAELVLTEPGPLDSYIRSTVRSRTVPPGQQDAYVKGVVSELESSKGEYRIRAHAGCLICS